MKNNTIRHFFVFVLSFFLLLTKGSYILHLKNWDAVVEPDGLIVYGVQPGQLSVVMGKAREGEFCHPVSVIDGIENQLTIDYGKIKAYVYVKANRLHVRFTAENPGCMVWPLSGDDINIKAIVYPDSEGMYIPIDDAFWLERFACGHFVNLSMPLYGYHLKNGQTIGYILHTDLRNELKFYINNGQLKTSLEHAFGDLDDVCEYEISMTFSGNNILGPAYNYKKYLIKWMS